MGVTVHADIGMVDQRPGLRDVQVLSNTHHLAGVNIQGFLHRVLDALQFGIFKYVQVFRYQVYPVGDHFQVLYVFDLFVADRMPDICPEIWFGE